MAIKYIKPFIEKVEKEKFFEKTVRGKGPRSFSEVKSEPVKKRISKFILNVFKCAGQGLSNETHLKKFSNFYHVPLPLTNFFCLANFWGTAR